MQIDPRILERLVDRIRRASPARIALACVVAFLAVPAQGAMALPSGMHYEMVSPADVNGTPTGSRFLSPDGTRIQVQPMTGQGFGGTPSFNTVYNAFVASRTPTGWVTAPMNVPASPDVAFSALIDFTPDLTSARTQSVTVAQFRDHQLQYQLVGIDGSVRQTLPVLTDLTGSSGDIAEVRYMTFGPTGSSADLSHAALQIHPTERLLPTDGPAITATSPGFRLYEVAGVGTAMATIRRVDVDDAGAEIGPGCGATLGGPGGSSSKTNLISADGSRIFFSANSGADSIVADCSSQLAAHPVKLFARVGGEHTVELSESECQRLDCSNSSGEATYRGASVDGGRVAFVSSDQLTDSDTDSTADLYLYDFSKPTGQHLTQVSIGDESDPVPGAGARVSGVVRMSDDGTRFYFVASGVLTTGSNSFSQTAGEDSRNLYLYEPATNKTSFIARVAATDDLLNHASRQSAQLSNTSGDMLVFSTSAPLAPTDTDGALDVYRYDVVSSELIQVSQGNTADDATIGNRLEAGLAAPTPSAISSDGGRVAFLTAAALAGEDVNGKNDVYLWDNGSVQMVSDGRDPDGPGTDFAISLAGDQVTFSTAGRLVPEDVDDVRGVYVAREGDDIVRPPDTTQRCDGDGCQGPLGTPPSTFIPDSATFEGAGDLDDGRRVVIGGIGTLSRSDRAKLARGGKARLRVHVNRAGTVTLRGSAKIGGADSRVVSASAKAKRAGRVSIPFTLARGARSALKRRGSLSLSLSVRFGDARPKGTAVVLRAPKAKRGGRS
jgi:hypothetical protein